VVTHGHRLAVVGYVILSLAVGYAIFLNRADIDQVCTTVQRQLDRNEATLQRSLDGQRLIQSNPVMARRKNVPGADYYADRPMELRAAIQRTERELHTYQGNAC
jgi:ADP-ribosylglycohydrolase